MLIVIFYSAIINAIFLSVVYLRVFEMRHAAFIVQNVDFKDENKVVHKGNTINFNSSSGLARAETAQNIVFCCRPHHDEMIHRPNQ